MNTTHLYRFVKASERLPLHMIKHCLRRVGTFEGGFTGYYDYSRKVFITTIHSPHGAKPEEIEWLEEIPYPSTDDALQAEAEALYKGNVRMRQAHINAIQLERARAKVTITELTDELKKWKSFGEKWASKIDELEGAKGTQERGVLQELGEKEVMIQAFAKFRAIFQGRSWVMDGRGSYPYNDDRYKQEVRYIFDEFEDIEKDMWRNIKTKTVEYRQKIIADYLREQKASVSTETAEDLIECANHVVDMFDRKASKSVMTNAVNILRKSVSEYASSRSLKDGEPDWKFIQWVTNEGYNWEDETGLWITIDSRPSLTPEKLYETYLNSLNKQ